MSGWSQLSVKHSKEASQNTELHLDMGSDLIHLVRREFVADENRWEWWSGVPSPQVVTDPTSPPLFPLLYWPSQLVNGKSPEYSLLFVLWGKRRMYLKQNLLAVEETGSVFSYMCWHGSTCFDSEMHLHHNRATCLKVCLKLTVQFLSDQWMMMKPSDHSLALDLEMVHLRQGLAQLTTCKSAWHSLTPCGQKYQWKNSMAQI